MAYGGRAFASGPYSSGVAHATVVGVALLASGTLQETATGVRTRFGPASVLLAALGLTTHGVPSLPVEVHPPVISSLAYTVTITGRSYTVTVNDKSYVVDVGDGLALDEVVY